MPKVLAWSATDQNPVDTEYIIMEEAKGSPLQEVWHDLQLRTKRDIIHEIIDVERKLLSVSFDREWDHFDSTEPCPFHYSSEEIREHRKEADVLNDNQALWGELRGILTDEGYTSNETFGRATELLEKLRETGLDRLKGDERNEFDREKRVVLDPSAPA
ncbi:MAG: hypothetical protein Q9157_004200 [Trypethelium eluteriae]